VTNPRHLLVRPAGQAARAVVFHQRITWRHLIDVAWQVIGVGATAPADVLLDAMPLAIIEKPCLAGGARRRVLPACEPPFGVVGEERAGGTAACTGGGSGCCFCKHRSLQQFDSS
jgi:hypothetical protein